MRILIVEDDERAAQSVERILRASQYETVMADSVESASHKVLADGPFDALLVDYLLPGGTGIDFIRDARTLGCQATAILMTGWHRTKVDYECDGLKVWCVIEKPFTGETLLEKVENACALSHIPPEREEFFQRALESEAKAMRAVTKDLMDETKEIPAAQNPFRKDT